VPTWGRTGEALLVVVGKHERECQRVLQRELAEFVSQGEGLQHVAALDGVL